MWLISNTAIGLHNSVRLVLCVTYLRFLARSKQLFKCAENDRAQGLAIRKVALDTELLVTKVIYDCELCLPVGRTILWIAFLRVEIDYRIHSSEIVSRIECMMHRRRCSNRHD